MQQAMSDAAPPVIAWFKIYAGAMAGLYILFALGLGVALLGGFLSDAGDSVLELAIIFGIIGLLLGVLAAAYIAPFFLPRKPWVWIYNLVLIAIGLSSCLTIIVCLPLLLQWVKPEARAYFGKT